VATAAELRETPTEIVGRVARRRSWRHDWWIAGALIATLVAIIAVVIVQRSEGRWVAVVQVVAPNESATRLDLAIGICNPSQSLPAPRVVETRNEVRISIDVHAPGGDNGSCAAGATVMLHAPLGERRVVDGHSHHQVDVVFTDIGATSTTGP
jgi:hypothetical protein